MTIGTLQVGGRKFRVIPEAEFRVLCKQAKAGVAASKRSARKPRKSGSGSKLKTLNGLTNAQWDEVVKHAKSNTKRLTGREVL
jgi:hypothetical protein